MKPTAEQMQASDPKQSVWVSASAGTGKTRILVNRMLRLLLTGNKPEKLLCITFTKAAAAEVLQRIQEIVLEWSICDADELHTQLQDLLDKAPHPSKMTVARRLLPAILQVPGGMKIMTIHAFCQSVLARFPLEANITPGFTVIDEQESQTLLNQAKHALLDQEDTEQDPRLSADLERFFDRVYEGNQNNLIQAVLNKRYRLNVMTQGLAEIQSGLCGLVGIAPEQLDSLSEEGFFTGIDHRALRECLPDMLSASGATLPKIARSLQDFLDSPSSFSEYRKLYLTQNNTVISNLAKGLDKIAAATRDIILNEAERCINFIALKNKADLVKDSMALLHIAKRITGIYQDLKKRKGVLDYEDQILLTSHLLQNPLDSQWVHYKLDGGIDHILVDEAQDTSPAQWAIIKGITEEFFAGNTREDKKERTLFVVGDEKQSIYSFQNADPVEFSRSRRFFTEKTTQNDIAWQNIGLIQNFRSAPLILKLTDQVFGKEHMARHISEMEATIHHQAFHDTRAGSIEIWPLEKQPDGENQSPSYADNPVIKQADAIAEHVKKLLEAPPLLSNGKHLQAGDIMILVRTREPLVSPLTKAFKDRNLPVSSADRLVLNEQLAVQDCLAAIQTGLHPNDDYAMACILKSPFIGVDEAFLYSITHGRGGKSLWDNLQQSKRQDIVDYIRRWIEHARHLSPGHFIHDLLSHPCPADKRSGRHGLITRLGFDSEDILDELLGCAYRFADENNPSCQAFLTWMQQNQAIIKRSSSDTDASRIQIMTVHAAKGLQAPYVFIADAHSKAGSFKSTRDVLWLQDATQGFLWGTGDALKTDLFTQEKERYIQEQFSEYYRLLYVALTRAEEHLVICGIEKTRNGNSDYQSWYDISVQALRELATSGAYQFLENDKGLLHLEQTGKTPIAKPDDSDQTKHSIIPEQLLQLPEKEEETHRPLRPSRPHEDDAPVFSPLHNSTFDPYRRGQVLHRLFKLIPDYPDHERMAALDQLLAHDLPHDTVQQQQLKDEVLNVLNDTKFAHLFTSKARAEVPVVGEIILDGQHVAISGQIDRLLIEDDRVLIVDYKTNRPPVLEQDKVPAVYRHQMRAYKVLLKKIYPEKRIETALLWTSVPYLLELSL